MYNQSKLRWLECILAERLHDDIQLNDSVKGFIVIRIKGKSKVILIKSNIDFMQTGYTDMTCLKWDLDDGKWQGALNSSLPAPGCGEFKSTLISKVKSGYKINYDILGLTYWMLSRVEEIGRTDLDGYGRFLSSSSHAYKYDYLERPIVDEWLLILGQVMRKLWPDIQLKQHDFKMVVSHDVDISSRYIFQKPYNLMRGMVSDIFKYGDLMSALRAPWMRLRSHSKLPKKDPLNTFEWIMDQSDKFNLTSSFYFIAGKTHSASDADYKIDHTVIRSLMKYIYDRGHEIGLHPSYNTYQMPNAIVAEAQKLKTICIEEGIEQKKWGGRMHYLRWDHPVTLYGWEKANMDYDSTLGYADHSGFRCGTCFEYPAYDPVKDKQLNLRIRPLIAMDVTITTKKYMDLGFGRDANDKLTQLKNACKVVNGTFTLLWHNNQLITKKSRDLYSSLLE
jgi:hypothetical protein